MYLVYLSKAALRIASKLEEDGVVLGVDDMLIRETWFCMESRFVRGPPHPITGVAGETRK